MSRPTESKLAWGPRYWAWLHQAAIRFPRAPSEADRQETRRQLMFFFAKLPCPKCRREAAHYVAARPPDLRDTDSFQSWAWSFHNAVNARLGRPEVPFDEYRRLYADELEQAEARAGARFGGGRCGPRPGLRRVRRPRVARLP